MSWIDPDSGLLEDHLLRHGFMLGFNQEQIANGVHEDGGGEKMKSLSDMVIMMKEMSTEKIIMKKEMSAEKIIMMKE